METLIPSGPDIATLSIVAGAVSAFLEDLKPLLRRLALFAGENAPFGLLVKLANMITAVFLYFADMLESASNPLEATATGFVFAYGASKVYDATKKDKPEQPATPEPEPTPPPPVPVTKIPDPPEELPNFLDGSAGG